jgi:hypothetical protein
MVGLLGPPLAVYAAARLAQLIAVLLVRAPRPVAGRIASYDGGWYGAIAARGYPHSLAFGSAGSAGPRVAFFPGYPMLVRAVVGTGVRVWVGELLVSLMAGAAAVALVCLVAVRVRGAAAGRGAGVAWALAPPGFVLGIGYSEGLFVAAAAGCLLGLLRHRWLLAGLAGAAATATRPTGAALVVAAVVAAVPVVLRQRTVRPLVAAVLVPAGAIGYLGWLWVWTGRADAWFVSERQGWGAHPDYGLAMAKVAGYVLRHPLQRPLYLVVAATGVASGALLVLAVRDRLPAPLLAYSAGILLLGGTSGMATVGSFPRIAYTAFPLFIPLGARLGRLPLPARLGLAAASLALMLLAAVLATTTRSYTP